MNRNTQPFNVRQHMLADTYEIYRYKDSYLKEVALHHHDFYEVYLFLSGNVTYSIESRSYELEPGDVLLISPMELHQPIFQGEGQSYERIVLWINKEYLHQFAAGGYDLAVCFDTSAPGHTNLVRPDEVTRYRLTDMLERILEENRSEDYCADLCAQSYLAQVMVTINRLVRQRPRRSELRDKSDSVVESVLQYINDHYSEDLSLDSLANRFFISKYHLSREFNRLVGTSVYRYIIQKRLIIAKQLMRDGVPSTVVYQQCGFGDYSNFYRAFKSEYRISPKEFVTAMKQESQELQKRIRENGWFLREPDQE